MLTALSIGRGGLGRFGNQAFTIAGVIGIAIKSGQPYGFPRWQTHDNANFGKPVDDIEAYLEKELPRIPTGMFFQEYGYFWGYRDIRINVGNWTIDAHLQSTRYFEHCMPLIQQTFRFKDEPDQNEFVAIHYRAGDYQNGEDNHHPRCTKEYYAKAMSHFPKGTRFIVFSDSPQEAWEVLDHYAIFYVDLVAGSDYIEDFKFMKKCKSFITANSSFSFMAAVLGEHPEKKIIMPSRWFGKLMPDMWRFNTRDIYPQNAIVI